MSEGSGSRAYSATLSAVISAIRPSRTSQYTRWQSVSSCAYSGRFARAATPASKPGTTHTGAVSSSHIAHFIVFYSMYFGRFRTHQGARGLLMPSRRRGHLPPNHTPQASSGSLRLISS